MESRTLILGLITGILLGSFSVAIYYSSQTREIKNAYELLDSNYIQLVETFNLYELTDSYIEIPFNLTLPNLDNHEYKLWLFTVGYGIIIQVRVGICNSEGIYKVTAGVNWLRGNEADNLGDYGVYFNKLPKYITGVAYCKVQFETEESICYAAGVDFDELPARNLDRMVKFPKKPS